ncbi:hypothetical protein [Nitrosomonas communis]|uniref:hypothetical protein n=1 Tax=Nitrosomonas communis TaxID=44574 RepID=UPI0026EFE9AD|nr:hypothetical protein [Nitrosomonas communis]MCO6427820.1 hypothetical protein [Nitrosomonas communis]
MNLTTWIDVAIGLTLIYLGVSLFVTIINEYIAQMLNLRGRQLRAALNKLIDNDAIKQTLLKNPALEPFFTEQPKKKGFYIIFDELKRLLITFFPTNRLPSYVDPNILGRMLIGSLLSAGNTHNAVNQISATIDKLSTDSALTIQLQAIVRTSGSTIENFSTAISDWLDRSLTMMSESYKRNLQIISFGVGLAIAVTLNINTITLTQHLYRDKETRDATTSLAIQIAEQTNKASFEQCINLPRDKLMSDNACAPFKGLVDAIQTRNSTLGLLPIGWPEGVLKLLSATLTDWLGWFMTALAVSLGAPFWFDLLNKVVSVRHGIRKPEIEQPVKKT